MQPAPAPPDLVSNQSDPTRPANETTGCGRTNEELRRAHQAGLAGAETRPARSAPPRAPSRMDKLETDARALAQTDVPVLLTGESGTGKSTLAREIHALSVRKSGPFVVLDCSTLAPSVAESELFGVVKGAFTGADKDRAGVLEAAGGGTLFLDEVGELPLSLQTKLLRFLESGCYRRVGSSADQSVDTRVIAATNVELDSAIKDRRFRKDLYFRLAVGTLHLPPLRERADELPKLVDALADELAPNRTLSIGQRRALLDHPWPGNLRELKNVLLRFSIFGSIDMETTGEAKHTAGRPDPDADTSLYELPFLVARERALRKFEQGYAEQALRRAEGCVSRAARISGVSRQGFYRILNRSPESDR